MDRADRLALAAALAFRAAGGVWVDTAIAGSERARAVALQN